MKALMISVDSIIRDSPIRTEFSDEQINQLAESILKVGLLHPILVKAEGKKYRLLAGHRRLQATIACGQKSIKAIILPAEADDRQISLIENLQRQDLNPVERASAINELMTEHKLNISQAARFLGVPRTTLIDWLDLVDIPQRYQDEIISNFKGGDSPLTLSHVCVAKALARSLNSPYLDHVLLDAVLFYKLSKSETREIAKIIKENADVNIDQAVRAIRHDYYVESNQEITEGPILLPHEQNLELLVLNLRRATSYLEKLNHISKRFIHQEQAHTLRNYYSEIMILAQRALFRLDIEKRPEEEVNNR